MKKYLIDYYYKDAKNKKNILELFGKNEISKLFECILKELSIDYYIELSVEWVDDEYSQSLNEEYRNKKYIPDVLSFPTNDNFYLQTNHRILGDLILNYNEMIRKTESKKNDLKTEGYWCFVHGVLHLLGYDHESDDKEKEIMFSLTDKILKEFNLVYNL